MAPVSALPMYYLVFVGDECVGKTNIINRFIHDKFNCFYEATSGIDDTLLMTRYLGVRTFKLQFWDTTGKKWFNDFIPSYISDSSAVVIVYDVSSRQSFINTSLWIEMVRVTRGNDIIVVLVGNKNDLEDSREVSTEEGKTKAREHNVMFMETSSKTGSNIKALFLQIETALPWTES